MGTFVLKVNSFGDMVPYMGPIFVIRYAMRRCKKFHSTKSHIIYHWKARGKSYIFGDQIRVIRSGRIILTLPLCHGLIEQCHEPNFYIQ